MTVFLYFISRSEQSKRLLPKVTFSYIFLFIVMTQDIYFSIISFAEITEDSMQKFPHSPILILGIMRNFNNLISNCNQQIFMQHF